MAYTGITLSVFGNTVSVLKKITRGGREQGHFILVIRHYKSLIFIPVAFTVITILAVAWTGKDAVIVRK